MQKEIPILFSTTMVEALIDGRKEQTRRIINPQPQVSGTVATWKKLHSSAPNSWTHQKHLQVFLVDKCPYGKPNDLLYVRETHFRFGLWIEDEGEFTKRGAQKWKFIPTTDEVRYRENPPESFGVSVVKSLTQQPQWYKRPALFMPKQSARIWLKNNSIQIERLTSISKQDAVAEGIQSHKCEVSGYLRYRDYLADASGYGDPKHDYPNIGNPITSFSTLWRKINGEESWKANPWLWVVTFEVLSKTGKPKY